MKYIAKLIHAVSEAIWAGRFCPEKPDLFRPLTRGLLDEGAPFLILADFDAYCAAQERAAIRFRTGADWTRSSILNVAAMGRFTSDRAVAEYARDIWMAAPAEGHRLQGWGNSR